VWKLLDVYKEFVTNGLDLISFMLVTPELLRVFAPAVREAPTFIIYILFFGILGSIIYFAWTHTSSWDAFARLGTWIYWIIYILVMVVTAAIQLVAGVGARGEAFIRRHGFLCGVILFLISRLFAFVVAARQVFSPIE
jgi:hypothetical protein